MAGSLRLAYRRPDMGRPSLYTPELAKEIAERLSNGEPLAQICRDDHMPAVRTVSHWKEADDSFKADFACAREEGHDAIASRLRETARGEGESTDDVQRDKLIIDTDLKLLAKWDKRYADRQVIAGDPDAPLVGVSDEQLDERLNALLANAGLT